MASKHDEVLVDAFPFGSDRRRYAIGVVGVVAVIVPAVLGVWFWKAHRTPSRLRRATYAIVSRAWSACAADERRRLRGAVVYEIECDGKRLAVPSEGSYYTVTLYTVWHLGEKLLTPYREVRLRVADLSVRSVGRPRSLYSTVEDAGDSPFAESSEKSRGHESSSERETRVDVPPAVAPSEQRALTPLAQSVRNAFRDAVQIAAKEAKKALPEFRPEGMDYTLHCVVTSDGRVMWYVVTIYRVWIGVTVPYREVEVTLSGDTLNVLRVVRLH